MKVHLLPEKKPNATDVRRNYGKERKRRTDKKVWEEGGGGEKATGSGQS